MHIRIQLHTSIGHPPTGHRPRNRLRRPTRACATCEGSYLRRRFGAGDSVHVCTAAATTLNGTGCMPRPSTSPTSKLTRDTPLPDRAIQPREIPTADRARQAWPYMACQADHQDNMQPRSRQTRSKPHGRGHFEAVKVVTRRSPLGRQMFYHTHKHRARTTIASCQDFGCLHMAQEGIRRQAAECTTMRGATWLQNRLCLLLAVVRCTAGRRNVLRPNKPTRRPPNHPPKCTCS